MIHLICPNPAIDRTLLVEEFQEGKPNRPYEVREFAGGKGFNVAYAIDFEEPKVEFCVHTILGGRNGAYLQELAAENHVPLKVTNVDVNTRFCNIIMDTTNANTYPVYENSFELSIQLLEEFTASLENSINAGDVIVFSGSLMKGMPTDYISKFIKKFADSDVKVFIDTSGAALVDAYHAKPYAIKINDEEILDLFPEERLVTIDDYAKLLNSDLTKDIPVFIITLGAKGIIGKINSQIFYLSAQKIDAKNPIASGDFFLGALVKNMCAETEPLETLKKAICYSTANVLNWFPELVVSDIESIAKTLEVKQYQ